MRWWRRRRDVMDDRRLLVALLTAYRHQIATHDPDPILATLKELDALNGPELRLFVYRVTASLHVALTSAGDDGTWPSKRMIEWEMGRP